MTSVRQKDRRMWSGQLERPVFDISQDRPVVALHNRWQERQEMRYDMHYGLELGVVICGKMRRDFRTHSFDVVPGDVWMCGMWEPHGYQVTGVQCEVVVMIIFPPVLADIRQGPACSLRLLTPFEAEAAFRPKAAPKQKGRIITVAEDIKEIIHTKPKNQDMWLSLKMTELLLVLLENWDQPRTAGEKMISPTQRINRAIKLIFDSDRFVSTQEAARVCGINRNAFASRFRDTMGISFSEFALRYRVSEAAKMLQNTAKPIKAIAAELGFTDTSHFYRCFSAYYRCSPTQYRLSFRYGNPTQIDGH